jgi:hypothetical protein
MTYAWHRALRRWFRVNVAGNGQEALDTWNRDHADAAVTDLKDAGEAS